MVVPPVVPPNQSQDNNEPEDEGSGVTSDNDSANSVNGGLPDLNVPNVIEADVELQDGEQQQA